MWAGGWADWGSHVPWVDAGWEGPGLEQLGDAPLAQQCCAGCGVRDNGCLGEESGQGGLGRRGHLLGGRQVGKGEAVGEGQLVQWRVISGAARQLSTSLWKGDECPMK